MKTRLLPPLFFLLLPALMGAAREGTLPVAALPPAPLPEVTAILHKIDAMLELKKDITARVEITHEKAGEGIKHYEAVYYRRDRDGAFLIVLTAPEVERGNGYLRLGENFWMYRWNTRTFQHISRDESIAGTYLRGEDMENRKLAELYQPALDEEGEGMIAPETLGKIPVYRIALEAKTEEVAFPKMVLWVRQDNCLPLKAAYYSLSGTLMLTSYFLNYTILEDKYMWVRAIHVDEFDVGNRTLVEIKNISLAPIDDRVFTHAYLESLSR